MSRETALQEPLHSLWDGHTELGSHREKICCFHFGGITIASDAVIGENVAMRPNVMIGQTEKGAPRIGNNVKIGIGACILGNVTIGDFTEIGACAVVVKDTPPHSAAAGNPARIVRINHGDKRRSKGRQLMKLISIGRFTEKLDYRTNTQNYTTWNAMSEYFEEIYLIVQSPDSDDHFEDLDRIKVYWIGKKRKELWDRLHFMHAAYKIATRIIRERDIGAINLAEPAVAGIPGVKLKKKYRLPLVTQVQGQLVNLPAGTFSALKTWYIKQSTLYTCKRSDRVRTVSDEIRESLIQCGVDSEKIVCVTSRCDTKAFDPKKYAEARTRLRTELHYRDSDIVIAFTGRVVAYRNVESDILALKKAIGQNDCLRLLVVGDGDDLENNRKLAHENGLDKYVTFYGRVPFERVPEMLSAADAFISTPTNDAIARSVLEAMAMELPVIAADVGGTKEAISNGENGILVTAGDVDGIADAMLKIAETPERMRDMGKKARNTIVERFEFEKQIQKFAMIHYGLGEA